MKKTTFLLALVITAGSLFAQKKTTTSATVSFDASTAADPVAKASNNTVIAAVDTKSGAVQLEATVKNFDFENKKVQEHFNAERWLNSDKFPKFTFKGNIDDLSKVNFKKDGTYTVAVTGKLTVKEVTKEIKAPATIKVANGVLSVSSSFSITLPDYGVMADGNKVSKESKITVSGDLK